MAGDARPHFDYAEFDSPDKPGSGKEHMDPVFLDKLEQLRVACGFRFVVTSGYRTFEHNRRVGGVEPSVHEDGVAADISAPTGHMKMLIVQNALKVGFRRIGIGAKFVHVDLGSLGYAQDVIWTY